MAEPVRSAGRVTGVGGVFLRARDPKALTDWYAEHLGFPVSSYGTMFKWADEGSKSEGMTIWSTFPDNTDYFGKGRQAVMINYRVDDLDALLKKLEAAKVTIDPHRQDEGYGKFAWITDPEGNRVELWQPVATAE